MPKYMKFLPKYIAISLITIMFYIIFGIITYGNHSYMLFFTLTTVYFSSIYIFKKNNPNDFLKLSLLLVLPLPIIFIMIFILDGEYSRGILYVIFIPISSLLAYCYYKFKKSIIIILSITTFVLVGLIGFPNLYVYLQNRNSVTNIPFPNVSITNNEKININLNDNKIIILDFWSTNCGICFSKFPDLEKTYLKYKKNQKVKIYAVNVPLKRDKFEKTIKILDSIGYKFPKLYAKSAKEMEDSLKIHTFPHLIILKNGRIRYDGILETEKNVFLYNIENEIDKLLNE